MREIKFRAWDEVDKKMRQVTRMTFGIPATGGKAFLVHLDDGTENPVTRHCEEEGGNKSIVMQYTGLKDKNGKEIYEGDILKYIKKKGRNKGEFHYWEVFFGDRGQWLARRGDDQQALFAKHETHEVCGNIYENPDLLASLPKRQAENKKDE